MLESLANLCKSCTGKRERGVSTGRTAGQLWRERNTFPSNSLESWLSTHTRKHFSTLDWSASGGGSEMRTPRPRPAPAPPTPRPRRPRPPQPPRHHDGHAVADGLRLLHVVRGQDGGALPVFERGSNCSPTKQKWNEQKGRWHLNVNENTGVLKNPALWLTDLPNINCYTYYTLPNYDSSILIYLISESLSSGNKSSWFQVSLWVESVLTNQLYKLKAFHVRT